MFLKYCPEPISVTLARNVLNMLVFTVKKIKFSIKDFFSKYDQSRRKLRLKETQVIFCEVIVVEVIQECGLICTFLSTDLR